MLSWARKGLTVEHNFLLHNFVSFIGLTLKNETNTSEVRMDVSENTKTDVIWSTFFFQGFRRMWGKKEGYLIVIINLLKYLIHYFMC